MGFLVGGNGGGLPAKDQLPLGQIPSRSATHQEGRVLPLLYGRQRVGAQFISDAFDIKIEAVSTGGKQSTRAGTNYYASFAVAVCHGPVTAFHDLYLNGDPVFSSTTKLFAVKLSMASNIATFQTQAPHNLTTGQTVTVLNADQPEFNGQFTIVVVSDTQFQYTIPGSSLPTETATPVKGKKIYCTVKLDPIYANGADSTDITIPDFGTATIYWGTETQATDAYLSGVSGIQHPPYKGICYIVFHQLFLGFNQTNVQNVEVVVERTPSFDWMTNTAHAVIAGDCNPGIVLADMLLNKRCGLACSTDDVDTAALDAAIEQLFSEEVGLSPLLTRPEEVRSQIVEILSMVDAAVVLDADGKLSIALQRQASIQALTIDETDLVDLPQFDPADWSSVINETYINYTDRDAGWNTDYVVWKDNAGFFAKNRPEPQNLDKPFITQKVLAQVLATILGQAAALPQSAGKLQIAYTDAIFASCAPGNGFTFSYTSRPALAGIYRITKRTLPDPAKPVFEIEVALDRSYLYTSTFFGGLVTRGIGGTPTGGTGGDVPPLEPIPTTTAALFELPVALCPNSQPAIAALVQRDATSTLSAQLWLGRNYVFNGTAPESFFALGTITKFALHGELTADYPASAATLAIANALPAEADNPLPLTDGFNVQLDGPDQTMPDVSDFDALANTVLLFVDGEIMSVAEASLTGAGAYGLTVIRGRFGTPIQDHAAGAAVYIIARADLAIFQHAHFRGGNTGRFKLIFDFQQISDVDAFDQVLDGGNWNFPVYLQQPPAGM